MASYAVSAASVKPYLLVNVKVISNMLLTDGNMQRGIRRMSYNEKGNEM